MTEWGSGSPPSRTAAKRSGRRSPRTKIVPDRKLLVKSLGFTAWVVGGDGDLWVEIKSPYFELGLCVLDLDPAVELLGVLTVAVERLREVPKGSRGKVKP